jgi:hypothetical protein
MREESRLKPILICVVIVLFGSGYARATWTTINVPGASSAWLNGISGNNIVGEYWYASGNAYSFLYTIPEPATLFLLGLGLATARPPPPMGQA